MTYRTPTALKAFFEEGDVPTESQFADLVDSIHLEVINIVAEGADNTGASDSSSIIQTGLSGKTAGLFPAGTYEFAAVTVSDIGIVGRNWPTFRAVSAGQEILQLNENVILERVIIDGESDTATKLQLGNTTGTPKNIYLMLSELLDNPSNSCRLSTLAEQVWHLFNRSENSKAFNTDDLWTGKNFTIVGGQFLDIPLEGGLVDPAGVENPTWHGVTHVGNQYEMAASGERALGIARVLGWVSIGNIYEGATGVSKDLIHIEDMAQKGLFCGELVDTNGAPIAVDGALAGNNAFSDQDSKNIAFMSLALFCDGTAKGFNLQGSSPDEFEKITIDGAHIDGPTVPVDARLQEGAVINTVSYDPQAPIAIITSQSIDNPNEDSPNAHNIIVTNNHAIRPTYIRGNVGTCFDPNSLLWRYSFANEGTLPTPPTGGPGSSATAAFGGSVGTGGTVTYPLSIAGDGIAGCKYQRATAGSTAMTRRIDIDFDAQVEDIQNGDCISVQVMCRSSVANRGRLAVTFPGAGPADSDLDLATTTDWQVLGVTKRVDAADDLFAGTGINVDLYLGENLANGETFDVAWIKVSHVSGY